MAEVSKTSVPDAGSLAERPFARVFYRTAMENRTGHLDIRDKSAQEGGKIMKRIIVSGGYSFFVKGGTPKETLPEILSDQGKLSAEQYEALKKETGGDFGKMEQKILTGAVVSPAELPDLIAQQTALKIKLLFALIKGHYEFKTMSHEQLGVNNVLVKLEPEKILYEGIKEHYPSSRIKKEFPGIEKKEFKTSETFKQDLDKFGLPPGVLRWLRATPESFSWDLMMKSAPLKQEEALALFLSFYFSDIITLAQGDGDFIIGAAYEDKKPAPAAKPAAPTKDEETGEKTAPQASPQPAEAAKPPEEPKLPIEEMLDKQLSDEEMLAEVDRLLKVVKKKDANYFDMLGVDKQTPPAKIKKIYFKFARRFHPDSRPDLFKDKVKDKVEDIFTRLTEAYDTLSDSETRKQYIEEVDSQLSQEDIDKASAAINAEMEFQKAEVLLKKGKWGEAAEILRASVEMQPDEPEYQMYLAWAEYKMKGVSEAGKAKKKIEKVVKERPKSADGHYYLGMIAKDAGELSEARGHLAKASQMKKHDIGIKRELQLIERRLSKGEGNKSQQKKGGGFFGRKK